LTAHQTIQSSAAIGIFNAIASQTIPQALPLMPMIVPGIAVSQQSRRGRVVLSDDAKFGREADDWPAASAYGGLKRHGVPEWRWRT
jgi:hypothetical protein